MVTHIWVITGGSVDVRWLKETLFSCMKKEENNLIIAADKGLFYAKEAEIAVDRILGDFDSLPEGILEEYKQAGVPIRTYPPEKDYTDTHLALMWALEEGADKVTILGGTGSRFDHSFANIGLLSYLLAHDTEGEIMDRNNRIFMMDRCHTGRKKIEKNQDKKEYISLIPYTERVTGITLTGFKYPLYQETLEIGISRGISNELVESVGTIEIEEGILMVVRSVD